MRANLFMINKLEKSNVYGGLGVCVCVNMLAQWETVKSFKIDAVKSILFHRNKFKYFSIEETPFRCT